MSLLLRIYEQRATSRKTWNFVGKRGELEAKKGKVTPYWRISTLS